ncbi:divalent-cation tolerance protein CutA [Ruficoccus amylovorans]|uniref:Divalent-cation tolerance protein CutA n=1 Tax=Ruficoccus amylovorans TaxID=1804625 RepID=A0A842HEW5_9BACT|nr:divalent-cation tolerance protein CutA [Ruficoccus amylovorans]MBC2594799.1 divalent-cation tolerance protein CutA [Ruficoccus amylovorans]
MKQLMIGWTTVSNDIDARRLAEGLTRNKMAACVQVEGPIMSHYHWQGKDEVQPEFRLTVKFPPERGNDITEYLRRNHPYQVFQWVAMPLPVVAPEYLRWAGEVTGS